MERHDALSLQFRPDSARPEFRRKQQWRGFSLEHARVGSIDYEYAWNGRSHYLALHDIVQADGEMRIDGMNRLLDRDIRDQMTYLPPDCGVVGWAKPADRPNSFTALCFDPAALAQEIEVPDGLLRPEVHFRDPGLRTTLLKLQTQILNYETADPVLTETLGALAALELFQLMRGGGAPALPIRGGLSRIQEKLVRDFIDENLAREIGLDDLAALVKISRFHFARAFKVSIGAPPHRFIQERRVERAKQLLVDHDLSLAEVARGTGFKTDAHFARVFKEHIGISPGFYRRGRL